MNGNERKRVVIQKALYVPDIGCNLLSVSKMVEEGLKLSFNGDECIISNESNEIIAIAKKNGSNLYKLRMQPLAIASTNTGYVYSTVADTGIRAVANIQHSDSSVDLWHKRLGHLNHENVILLKKRQLAIDFPLEIENLNNSKSNIINQCEDCVMGKTHRTAMPSSRTHYTTKVLEMVHSDVCGPMTNASIGGAKFFVTFIDDFSRYIVVVPLKSKAEVLQCFIKYRAWAENLTGEKIKTLRSDNGGEYCSKDFNDLLAQAGISRQKSPPYTSEHNGVAERANRTLMECARSMLHGAHLSYFYWGEAITTAAYLRNRSPSKALKNVTAFEVWTGQKPSLNHLKVFGCKAYVHIPKEQRTKLEVKAVKCIFVGYSMESKAYRLYDPSKGRIIISRDVTFFEDKLFHDSTEDGSNSISEIVEIKTNTEIAPSNSIPQPLNHLIRRPAHVEIIEEKQQPQSVVERARDVGSRSSSRFRQPPLPNLPASSALQQPHPVIPLYDEYQNIISDARNNSSANVALNYSKEINVGTLHAYSASEEVNNEPINFTDALNRSDAKQWEKAAEEEYNSIQAAGTWSLVPLPNGRTPIGCKWVFKIKHNADGSVDRYKARLVAKGFTQKEGIDFNETFAPVAKFSSIRAILSLAAASDMELHQMDVKTAFLNGNLEEEIYMNQPEGFIVEGKENLVCKLQKSIYGLKQASRSWYHKMDQAMSDMGFNRLQADPCIYTYFDNELIIYVALYVLC